MAEQDPVKTSGAKGLMSEMTSGSSVVSYAKYSWLRVPPAGAEYLAPVYYNALLKEYRFGGERDLDIFESAVREIPSEVFSHSLEIGPGTFRATKVFLTRCQPRNLLLLDLSRQNLLPDILYA